MRKFNYAGLIIVLIFLFSCTSGLLSKEKEGNNKARLNKVTANNPSSNVVDINNITTWVGSDGFHDWVVASSWNGSFPKGSAVGAIFAEGIVWGGKVSDGQTPIIRVNGNTYQTGCLSVFNPPRVFRVRPDFQTGSLADDAANFNNVPLGSVTQDMIDAVKAQYEQDWKDWPASEGAPFDDVNHNGVYDPDPNNNGIYGEPGEDIPGVPGAAQTLYTKYTDALSATNYASPPIGLEVQETYWSYAYTGALGNVIYKKVDMVYKGTDKSASNSRIDSMYIVQWADPDVGTSTDDFAGCDTALNLGYAYTSKPTDATYAGIGLAPPAVGYDFLQGVSQPTGNLNDSAIFNLHWRKGYKYVNPKPMSSFIYFAAGGHWQDPTFDYQGTLQFYNLMRGQLPGGGPFPKAVADVTPFGTYLLDGDPVAGTGKLDGNAAGGGDSPGDRRIMVVNGPITLKLHDTVEVVVALVGGLATDNLTSVTAMKSNDKTAQIVYDQLFKLPTLPPPVVHVEQLQDKVILDWGSDPNSVSAIENFSSQGYKFEGYDVYQLSSPSAKITDPNAAVKIATFDLVNGIKTILDTVEQSGVKLPVITETGTDNGIKRYLEVTKNPFRGNQPLRNGQEYYFAVVPYAFNPSPLLPFHALQSTAVIKVAVPQSPKPGVRYSSAVGDTIKNISHTGPSDGTVQAIVIDPSLTTGDVYKVKFAADGTWFVVDSTKSNKIVASGQTNQSGGDTYPIVDGMLVKVFGPPVGMKGWSIPSGTRRFSPVGGAKFGLEGFSTAADTAAPQDPANGTIGAAVNFGFGNIATTLSSTGYHDVLLKLAAVDNKTLWDPNAVPTDPNFSLSYRYLRSAADSAAKPEFVPWIKNKGAGYPYQDYLYGVPFSAWDLSTNPPTRLAVGHLENNQPNGLVDGRYWPGTTDVDNGAADGPREFAFIFATPYTTTPDTALAKNFSASTTPLMWVMTCARRADVPWAAGDEFLIKANHVNTVADEFTINAPSATANSNDLAKADINKINVFPNPYYGFQYRETSRDAKYVTFSHLPPKAVIRIFDLSGVLVRTISSKDPNSQFTTWDLKNDNNYPVASGVYIIYIDMPDLGATKILKLALIQEEQILKVY